VQYPDDSLSNPSAIRIEELLGGDDDSAGTSPSVPVREGLPRTFRMRADKHYVEMLDTPATGSPGESSEPPLDAARGRVAPSASQTEAARVETDRALPDPGAAVAVQAGRDLAQSLAALRASTSLLSDRGPGLATTVAANLIRAEAWRATCLLQAGRFLRGEISPVPKPVQPHAIIDQVLKSIEPERRLRGIALEERIHLGDARILADEELLVCAVSGLLMATIALAEEHSPLSVTVSALERGGEIVMAIAQDTVRAPANWATDAVPVAAAGRIVAACRGRIAAAVTASGTDIRLAFPALR
jgi:hypothetical protein